MRRLWLRFAAAYRAFRDPRPPRGVLYSEPYGPGYRALLYRSNTGNNNTVLGIYEDDA